MIFRTYTLEEIETLGGSLQSSTLFLHEHSFQRGPKCRKNMQTAIQDYCKNYQRAGQGIVLVEDDIYITIWKQPDGFSPDEAPSVPQGQNASIASPLEAGQRESAPEPLPTAALSPEIIDDCRNAMLMTIGPIANIIVNDILAHSDGMDTSDFIEALVKRLPNSTQVERFKQRLQK